jgi:hypothetical protein
MPIQNIVLISEIDACVAETLDRIRQGVAAARKAGLNCELPESVEFSMVVVKDWQRLEMSSDESGNTTENRKGSSQDTDSGTETKTAEEIGSKKENEGHRETHESTSIDFIS